MEYTECEDSFSWWLILTGGRPRQLPIKDNVHRQEIMYFMMVFFTGYIVSVLKFLWWGIRQTSLCSYGLVESLGKTINYQVERRWRKISTMMQASEDKTMNQMRSSLAPPLLLHCDFCDISTYLPVYVLIPLLLMQ